MVSIPVEAGVDVVKYCFAQRYYTNGKGAYKYLDMGRFASVRNRRRPSERGSARGRPSASSPNVKVKGYRVGTWTINIFLMVTATGNGLES